LRKNKGSRMSEGFWNLPRTMSGCGDANLNISRVTCYFDAHYLLASGKPIRIVPLLPWMRAARSPSRDWTVPCLLPRLTNARLRPVRIWQTRLAVLRSVGQKVARPSTHSPAFERAPMKCSG
jgi:hypothetical protein